MGGDGREGFDGIGLEGVVGVFCPGIPVCPACPNPCEAGAEGEDLDEAPFALGLAEEDAVGFLVMEDEELLLLPLAFPFPLGARVSALALSCGDAVSIWILMRAPLLSLFQGGHRVG